MARCGFFSLEVSWFDEEWFISVPDKDKANIFLLDVALNGLVMNTYDIPVFNAKYMTPEQIHELKVSIEIPLTQKVLKFRRISEVTGWRKGKIIQYLNELERYDVIKFHVEDKNRVSVLHIKAYERLTKTQQNYFSKVGVKVDTIKAYKIAVAQSYDIKNKISHDDDSSLKEENQSSENNDNRKLNLDKVTKGNIDYINKEDIKDIYYNHFTELNKEQQLLIKERCLVFGIKNKAFMHG
tara:strand:+ start:3448 stop:4164 length:717 start_codon:yes stop_codon:yes gene_type:complete